MTTRKEFLEAVKHLNATFEEDASGFSRCITVDAPRGFRFNEGGAHCLVEPFTTGLIRYKQDTYGELVKRMSYGLESCKDPDCDVCHDG